MHGIAAAAFQETNSVADARRCMANFNSLIQAAPAVRLKSESLFALSHPRSIYIHRTYIGIDSPRPSFSTVNKISPRRRFRGAISSRLSSRENRCERGARAMQLRAFPNSDDTREVQPRRGKRCTALVIPRFITHVPRDRPHVGLFTSGRYDE